MKNLMKIHKKTSPTIKHFALLPPALFNRFLSTYVNSIIRWMNPQIRATNLLGIETKELNTARLRKSQEKYYSLLGISPEKIDQTLQFSTPSEKKGIYLSPQGEIPEEMGDTDFFRGEEKVFLKVFDADNRVVSISKEGFEILEKIQRKMVFDLFGLMERLNKAFPNYLITGRVKSARSFLDKCGRLSEKTQQEQTQKCIGIKDIVDGAGCRITCSSSSQIYEVIQQLQKEGLEFLELDNKYNTIRKDGAYKVIPCAMRDSKTGLIFELQITTLTSTTVADLFHNVIYKRNAIGLNPTKEESQAVLSIQRFGALTETASLVSEPPIVLTEDLKGEKMNAALDILSNMVETVKKEGTSTNYQAKL